MTEQKNYILEELIQQAKDQKEPPTGGNQSGEDDYNQTPGGRYEPPHRWEDDR